MAGRALLIEIVNASIPSYFMQYSAFPIKTVEELDKINRNFLWGSTKEKRKIHLVGWEEVTKPKQLGGLGIKSMRPHNKALLGGFASRATTSKSTVGQAYSREVLK